jgi:hypothetical protein
MNLRLGGSPRIGFGCAAACCSLDQFGVSMIALIAVFSSGRSVGQASTILASSG